MRWRRRRPPGCPGSTLSRPRWLTTPPIAVGRRGGWIALSVLLLATLAVVAYASSGPTVLVPRSVRVFPNWEAGPLHLITSRPLNDRWTLDVIFSCVLVAMLIAYGVAMAAIRSLTMRSIVIVVRDPAPDPAAEPAAAAVGHLQLPGLRAARGAAPHLAVHARDLVRALRPDLPVRQLGQPQEPLRRAVHGGQLPARVPAAADRVLGDQGGRGAAQPRLPVAGVVVCDQARPRSAVRRRLRRAEPDLSVVCGRRVPQRLPDAGRLDGRDRVRAIGPGSAGPARRWSSRSP